MLSSQGGRHPENWDCQASDSVELACSIHFWTDIGKETIL